MSFDMLICLSRVRTEDFQPRPKSRGAMSGLNFNAQKAWSRPDRHEVSLGIATS